MRLLLLSVQLIYDRYNLLTVSDQFNSLVALEDLIILKESESVILFMCCQGAVENFGPREPGLEAFEVWQVYEVAHIKWM